MTGEAQSADSKPAKSTSTRNIVIVVAAVTVAVVALGLIAVRNGHILFASNTPTPQVVHHVIAVVTPTVEAATVTPTLAATQVVNHVVTVAAPTQVAPPTSSNVGPSQAAHPTVPAVSPTKVAPPAATAKPTTRILHRIATAVANRAGHSQRSPVPTPPQSTAIPGRPTATSVK